MESISTGVSFYAEIEDEGTNKSKSKGKTQGQGGVKNKRVKSSSVFHLETCDQSVQTEIVNDVDDSTKGRCTHVCTIHQNESELLSCIVCMEPFNGDHVIPMVSLCGHITCRPCLTRLVTNATESSLSSSFSLYPRPNVKNVICPVCRMSLNPNSFIKLSLSSVHSLSADIRLKVKKQVEAIKKDHLTPASICMNDWANVELAKLTATPVVVGKNMLKKVVPALVKNMEANARLVKAKFVKSQIASSITGLEKALQTITELNDTTTQVKHPSNNKRKRRVPILSYVRPEEILENDVIEELGETSENNLSL